MDKVLSQKTMDYLVVLTTTVSEPDEWLDDKAKPTLVELGVPERVKTLMDGILKPFAKSCSSTQAAMESHFFMLLVILGLEAYRKVVLGKERNREILEEIKSLLEEASG